MANKAIKNKNILKANPQGIANMAFIKALYKERGGYKPTQNELRKFENMRISDVTNLILGKGKAQEFWPQQTPPTTATSPTTPIAPTPEATPTQPDWASQIAELLQPAKAVPPTFEQSGLFNEADVNAQAEAEYSPYFSNALAELIKGTGRQREDIGREQAQFGTDFARQQQDLAMGQGQAQNTQMSDYLNRGLSRSGGLVGAQQQMGQQQALATQKMGEYGTERQRQFGQSLIDVGDEEERQKKELAQRKAGSLQDYRQKAYQNAYNQYLNRNY